MSEERPLTAFSTDESADSGDTASPDVPTAKSDECAASAEESASSSDVSPASTGEHASSPDESAPTTTPLTSRFLPEGADCEQCGAETETQWADDGRFVCAACKRWAADTD